MATPAFVKNPKFIKFIGGTIIILWVAYVIYWNHQLEPINIQLFPLIKAQLNVSSVIMGAALFGCIATLLIQLVWRRSRSKKGSTASTAPAASNKTVA